MSESHPLVSIITAVYNTSERLAACLDSLLAQTLPSFEVIAVNDGSTDNSAEICREYAKKYPGKFVFLDGPNGGVCVAQNKALDVARGDWIGICDSDDFIVPEMFEYLYRRAVDNQAQFSTCALICDGSAHEDIRMPYPVKGEAVLDKQEIATKWLLPFYRCVFDQSIYGYVTLALFKRSIIEEHHLRFIPGLSFAEDEAFFMHYLQYVDRAAVSDKVLYHYIVNQQSLCYNFFRKKTYDFGKKERFWRMLWKNRLDRFREFKHEAIAPAFYLPTLFLNTCYHSLQEIFYDSLIPDEERKSCALKLLEETTKDPDYDRSVHASGLPTKLNIFCKCLDSGYLAVRTFCFFAKLAAKN